MDVAGFTDLNVGLTSSPEGVELRGAVSVDSFEVQDEELRGHVLAPDFLDAERHPELTFRSTAFGANGDEVVVGGDLTIKGTTRGVEARGTITDPVADPFGGERIALALETIIDRTEFGLGWNMDLPTGGVALANDVRLIVELELVKE